MSQQYNQFRAMLAITKASLLATFRSPQSIFFGLFFPIVLIWIFGSLSGGGAISVDVAFEKNVDSTNKLYYILKNNKALNFRNNKKVDIEEQLRKGRITAIINVSKGDSVSAPYNIHLRTTSAGQKDMGVLSSVLNGVISSLDKQLYPDKKTVATITQTMEQGKDYREYKYIDFFLPGMIGFSLIGSAVFGVAFSFYSLRETLVLKRMYSTPIKRGYIILGESLGKICFQLLTVIVLILFGRFGYHFTLAHGWLTFLDMMLLSFIALLVFMGFGFFFSGVAKNQNVIPIYANLFMFPQYFLSGTFFSRAGLPAAIQPIIKFLPLTAVNDAMRNVAFEGASLISCWPQLLTLVVWGVLVYAVTARVFKWE